MNNVITILVDSVYSECIGKGRTVESSTPFYDSLIDSSLFCKNIYSYGPYTDAATKGLFCGNNTLDDYGYYFSINSSEYNPYRLFKESGYETVGLYYPYYLLGTEIEQYIDHSIYISGFRYAPIWAGKFEYYAEKYRKNKITEEDYLILEKFVDLLFDCWITFYKNLVKKEAGIIIERIKNSEKDGYKLLCVEYEKYMKNRREYIDTILSEGMGHALTKVNDYDYDKLVIEDFVKEIFKENKSFFQKLEEREIYLNAKNNKLNVCKILEYVRDKAKKNPNRYMESFGLSLFGSKFMRHNIGPNMRQIEASMMNQLNALFTYLDSRENDKPFYVSMHTEEPHNRLMYFTYDIANKEMVLEELKYMEPLIDNLGSGFKGNIIYQLSLRYVDLGIKRLFEGLKKRGLLENTTIMIMADHGSSYTFFPLRSTAINNFFVENYRTPLLIWNAVENVKWKKEYTGYYQSADVFATLCDIENINFPGSMTGKSMLDVPNGRDYVITEYMGPGCPVMTDREVWMSINNKKYMVAIKCILAKRIDLEDIVEIYDMEEDPLQLNNIVNKKRSSSEIGELLNILRLRHMEIARSSKLYLEKVKKNCI